VFNSLYTKMFSRILGWDSAHRITFATQDNAEERGQANDGVSKSFRTESITKFMLTFPITRWEARQRVMASKLTRLTHKIAIQLDLVVESCTICNSGSTRTVRKLLD